MLQRVNQTCWIKNAIKQKIVKNNRRYFLRRGDKLNLCALEPCQRPLPLELNEYRYLIIKCTKKWPQSDESIRKNDQNWSKVIEFLFLTSLVEGMKVFVGGGPIPAGFLYRAGAEALRPPQTFEKFSEPLSEQVTIFSEVDTQTAFLVSVAKAWISAPDS